MSKLYGKVSPDGGKIEGHSEATKQAHQVIEVWAQTEYGRVIVSMNANGQYTVGLAGVGKDHKIDWSKPVIQIAAGNANEPYVDCRCGARSVEGLPHTSWCGNRDEEVSRG